MLGIDMAPLGRLRVFRFCTLETHLSLALAGAAWACAFAAKPAIARRMDNMQLRDLVQLFVPMTKLPRIAPANSSAVCLFHDSLFHDLLDHLDLVSKVKQQGIGFQIESRSPPGFTQLENR